MGIPVRLKEDGFIYLGESFDEGDIFNAPHECMASFLCEQEGKAERVSEEDCEPEKVGTMKRGTYKTRVMSPEAEEGVDFTKPAAKPKTASRKKAKAPAKPASNESSENT